MTEVRLTANAGWLASVVVAGAALALALVFMLAFFAAKHRLAAVSPFVDDPYDAVASFGIQIALFAAMASVARTILNRNAVPRDHERLFVIRGHMVVLAAMLVTGLSDVVAIGRHVDISFASPAGRGVAVLGAGIAAISAAAMVVLVRLTRPVVPLRSWGVAALVCLGEVAVLAAYPEGSRRSFPGALAAAWIGMAVLFLTTWGLTEALLPSDRTAGALLERVGVAFGVTGGEHRAGLNHPWRFVTAAALAAGGALVVIEATGEGLPSGPGRVVMLIGVIVGIEATGVLLGAVMFRRPLGLF